MPGSDDAVQRAVHALETGGMAVWIRRALAFLLIVGLALFYLLHEFRGLATSQAMDQAQIGRELLHGHGWKTKFARPLAAGQLQRRGKDVAGKIWTDTYNAPLPPLVDAIALLPVRSHLKMTTRDIVYLGDKMIALLSMVFFLASVVVLFLIACRLFDQYLAVLGCALVLLGDTFWQYSLSGLPQMLLLLLFNLTLYVLVRAIEARAEGRAVLRLLGLAGAGFGLLALSHALTIWIFLPTLIFAALYFRPRLWAAIWMLAPFLLLYTPWLLRNYLVCGNPAGVALFSFFDQIGMSEAGHMRHLAIDYQGMSIGVLRDKISDNVAGQASRILQYFGWSVVALFFFAALLHRFRRAVTATTRWFVFVMWGGAVVGMAVYGVNEEQGVAANQLHLLFVPIMTCFGLAYLLVLWNRLQITSRLARFAFLTLFFVLCGGPMIFNLLFASAKTGVRWPPYVAPYIAVINDWMKPEEITATDMPWAVAWYADRRAVWLPDTIRDFTDMSDYDLLGGKINGLYLTPISGSQNTLKNIVEGEYKGWAPVILRSVDLKKFPLPWATLLPLDDECIFFSDHDRRKASTDQP
ncbi:MAG TPA: glycosyltransferase family 39 protein [Chthoniobacterales bacterium]|nr:glycosyltransferase family 39 protein [Chthoniobacterales bacterium]